MFGVGLIAFSFSRVLSLSLAVPSIVGAGMMITMASAPIYLKRGIIVATATHQERTAL